ncbi:MAG: murein transglycosylase A [Alphaproteobacteria bacterium]
MALFPRSLARFLTAVLALAFLVVACTKPPVPKPETVVLTPVTFGLLPGWRADRQGEALVALRKSCVSPKPGRIDATPPVAILAADWAGPCQAAQGLDIADDAAVRAFFERWFRPYRVANGDRTTGLFTGYFEAELRGARQKDGRYTVPLYRLPDDHVTVDLSKFDPSLAGKRIVGRVESGRLEPYYARGDIDGGALSGKVQELIWVDDAIDVFVLHVQGSGRVILPDGNVVRIGYAGNNGLPYRSIGRELIDRGALPAGGASWGDIRRWIETNRDQAAALLAVNPRYIFFREVEGDGPIGAAGVALTPRRSLAVDPRFVPYGAPVWLDTNWPNAPEKPLRRLMIAQDTGSAIRGPIRGDFFWGYGAEALSFAGRMKSQGAYFLLLPRAAVERMTGS